MAAMVEVIDKSIVPYHQHGGNHVSCKQGMRTTIYPEHRLGTRRSWFRIPPGARIFFAREKAVSHNLAKRISIFPNIQVMAFYLQPRVKDSATKVQRRIIGLSLTNFEDFESCLVQACRLYTCIQLMFVVRIAHK